MVARHREDQIGALTSSRVSSRARCPLRSSPCSRPDQIRALGDRRTVPRTGAGGRDRYLICTPAASASRSSASAIGLRQVLPVQTKRTCIGQNISGAGPLAAPSHGASLPAARRSSARGIAPSRTSRGTVSVQSTSVDGGTLPSTPPSSTSSSPRPLPPAEQLDQPVGAGRRRPPGTIGRRRGERLAEWRRPAGRCRRATCAAPRCRPPARAARRAAALAPGEHQGQRTGPERVRQRRRRRSEHQPPLFGHPPAGDEQQERLALRPPLEPAERSRPPARWARSRGRRPSRWDRPAARPRARCSPTCGIAAVDLGVGRKGRIMGPLPRAAPPARGPRGVVTLRLRVESGTSRTGCPHGLHQGGVVGGAAPAARPARGPAPAAAGEIPAASAPARAASRGRVRRSRVGSVGSASFSVSLSGTAGDRALAGARMADHGIDHRRAPRTAARHRAPARRRSRRAGREARRRPSRCARDRRRRSSNPEPMSGARNAGGVSAWSGGEDQHDMGDIGMGGEGPQGRSSMGTPATGKLLGDLAAEAAPLPRRHHDHADVTRQARAPAARLVEPDHRDAGDLRRAPGRAEHPAEAEPGRLRDPPLDRAAGPDLATEADLAEEDDVGGGGPVVEARTAPPPPRDRPRARSAERRP